ncbi:MAG: 30S ribosomal protein S20 [Bacteroidia bacterium]|jgi:small subunit ribosomal protein S20
MANIKSAKKRIRNSETKRLRNRYQHKSTRTVLKKFQLSTLKDEALSLMSKAAEMVDKLAKNNIIHKNKAANIKSKMMKRVAAM